ncbi:hypothetical protein OUZ56_024741 [Daphnia magna]|uniref:Uncharacterized protein n=1 Tax=Daphnia magna TaxID=35525 RepID=A0ABQ9ZHW2_9CRUS|nr:hypothetical protein OUZ56_024741 [Daphnia magna]
MVYNSRIIINAVRRAGRADLEVHKENDKDPQLYIIRYFTASVDVPSGVLALYCGMNDEASKLHILTTGDAISYGALCGCVALLASFGEINEERSSKTEAVAFEETGRIFLKMELDSK